MFDPGHAFRRAFSWLPSHFASQSDAPVGPRQFGSTEHLSIEAIAGRRPDPSNVCGCILRCDEACLATSGTAHVSRLASVLLLRSMAERFGVRL